ncbi:polyprenyl diphosphate synthase [Cognaticolwellia beringensis]|uniref:Ditrans,polycis-undecaprenyl-diphosphate synthase ((2E,6E)-farnesyl-diphosphate specific) n=1 Tax=Cognaticolwellia beringensis TaxID=1967665 RepID=A0A222GBZ7_9GAMM|nr:polyprenyl diphosphate synthase [Cognaticolwellia beringensis]ASP49193.1 di-trans,poly-cis-decaprenylcistransferase [Cognaticolwellia beringensis]
MSKTDNQTNQLLTTEARTPQHVAIIMDGNGRWAQLRGKKRAAGHKSGVETVRTTVAAAAKNGVKALTLFAFSSENWQRPESEVSVLMDLFMFVLTREVKRLHKNGIKFNVIGDLNKFSSKLQKMIKESEALTAENTGMVLSIAANYGGRWDITHAAKKLAEKVARQEITAEEITEDSLNEYTSLAQLPELDLLIRTGGDYRISNFLLWQAAYAELYFTDVLWPDFNEIEFTKAMTVFDQRERRFGQTGEQVTNKN